MPGDCCRFCQHYKGPGKDSDAFVHENFGGLEVVTVDRSFCKEHDLGGLRNSRKIVFTGFSYRIITGGDCIHPEPRGSLAILLPWFSSCRKAVCYRVVDGKRVGAY